MKKKRIAVTILLCVIIAGAAFLVFRKKNAEYVEAVSPEQVQKAYELLAGSLNSNEIRYTDFLKSLSAEKGTGSAQAEPVTGEKAEGYDSLTANLNYQDYTEFDLTVEKAGIYYLMLDYKPMGDTLSDFSVELSVNGEQAYSEMKTIALPLLWHDETKEFPLDSYGDESEPVLLRNEDWTTVYLYNNTYSTAEPLLFPLSAGVNRIRITNVSADGLGIGRLQAVEPDLHTPSYADYKAEHGQEAADGLIGINATDYTEKNTTQAIYSSVNEPSLTPHDNQNKKLNTLNWTETGTEVTYEFEVENTGSYNLAFHYLNGKQEFDAFQTIKIDGKVPFTELMNYAFPSTGSAWKNLTLSDENGEAYQIYLEAGKHTVSIRAEQEYITEAWRYARLISEHAMQFSLDITKITGSEKDKNRTWKMTKYIPDIPKYLDAYRTLIQHIQYLLQDYTPNGVNGALLSDLDKALQLIDKMAKYPDEIALYTEDLTGADNSVLVSISNFSTEITKQKFGLDMIYVYQNKKLPAENKGIFANLGNSIMTLVHSFTTDKYSTKVKDDEVVTVWVNRALTHVDLLQKMADTDFTPKTGIKVKITAIPDANKLTMAAAAEQTPDIALGLGSYMPFDLASRGALYDMTEFPDFWMVADRFTPGSLVSYIYNEGVYGLPEALDFQALVYRKDIFNSLELTPPDTWQDVKDILPQLQRYGMNFYHNIAAGVGYKWFWQTSSLLYQNNGRLYTDDGMHSAIDEPNSVKGIKELGDLFIAYSLDKQVNSFFNSFRYSMLPVGLIDIKDYILIKNGAPELEGQWALAPYPGTVQEDGSVSRWYVTAGTGGSGVIFDLSKKKDDAWEFMKWWTDHDTQVNYTYTLQSTYGKEFFWLSSNISAVEDAPIEQADKQVILEQLKWLRDVPRTPGQYLLERSVSDIWNAMVNDGKSAQVSVDEKTIAINREIKKKLIDLGILDENGEQLKSYVVKDIPWILENIEKAKSKEHAERGAE